MALVLVKHYCPCCGYPGLNMPAYRRLGPPPWLHPGPPPYERWYGAPSYDVCPCCGFEFGNDDNPGTAPPSSFEQFRRAWIESGCPWFDPSRRPAGWRLEDQLAAAGIVDTT
jgi:hypothetical protein